MKELIDDKFILLLLVLIHHIFIVLLIITPVFVMINEPFWIWVPVNVWVMHLIFSPVLVCPATIWENRLRRKLKMPEIRTFIKHYYINPVKRFLRTKIN